MNKNKTITTIKKANKKIFGSMGAKIPISKARDELYLELKKIWYGNVA